MKLFVERNKGLILVLFLFIVSYSYSQSPTTGDCLGAIQVCQDSYFQPNTASGVGNIPNEVNGQSACPVNCLWGERNSTWYRFTVQSAGLLSFIISPIDQNDDYDWAVYDITTLRCDDIFSQAAQMVVSCNSAGGAGFHGDTGPINGFQECNGPGNTNKWNVEIPVNAGETYVLYLSDWTQSPTGYSLDFSPSTALIYDTLRPSIGYVFENDLSCGDTELEMQFSEFVQCATVHTTSFTLDGPGGPYTITDVSGIACEIGGEMENYYTLSFDPPLSINGTYTLSIVPFSSIKDGCDNIALPENFEFDVDLGAPDIIEDNMVLDNASCGFANGSITGIELNGVPPYTITWTDGSGNVVGDELDIFDLSSGLYTLTVSDESTCESIGGPYNVMEDGAPTVDASAMVITPNTCDATNGSIMGLVVTGVGDLTYTWTDGSGNTVGNEVDLIDRIGGEYYLSVVDENDCESITGPYIIEDFASPSIFEGNMLIVGATCGNANGFIQDLVVTGSSTLTFDWQDEDGNSVGSGQDLQNVLAGTYTLYISDENNCTAVAGPYIVEDIAGPVIDEVGILISTASCNEDNGSISGLQITGNSGLTISWTNENGDEVGTNNDLVGVPGGIYYLNVEDAAGCVSNSGPYTIDNIGGAFVDAVSSDSAYCELNNGIITIAGSGGLGDLEYSVDGISYQAEQQFTGLAPGTYTVTVRDDYGCVTPYANNPLIIENFGSAITAEILGDNPICEGADLQLDNEITNATYDWVGPDGFSSNVKDPMISAIPLTAAGMYTLIVVENDYSCTDTAEMDLVVLPSFAPSVEIQANRNPAYPADSIIFTAVSLEVGANPSYEWYLNGNLVQSDTLNYYATTSIYANAQVQVIITIEEPCADPNPANSDMYELVVAQPELTFPNAFRPNSTQGNHIFKPVTNLTYIPSYYFAVYTRWGQRIYETQDVTEGWDGMINGKEAPADSYVWQVNYNYNSEGGSGEGKAYSARGTITLIR